MSKQRKLLCDENLFRLFESAVKAGGEGWKFHGFNQGLGVWELHLEKEVVVPEAPVVAASYDAAETVEAASTSDAPRRGRRPKEV